MCVPRIPLSAYMYVCSLEDGGGPAGALASPESPATTVPDNSNGKLMLIGLKMSMS